VVAQFVYVAAAGGPDAADWDTQPGADFGIGDGRVLEEQGDQLLAGGRQSRERLAQRGVALGRQEFLLGRPGLVICHVLELRHGPGCRTSVCRGQDLKTFPAGDGDQPARQGGRVADRGQLVYQLQPHLLADVFGVGVGQPVLAAEGPHQRAEPFHQRIPGVLIARCGAGQEVDDDRVVAHRVTAGPRRCRRATRGGPAAAAPLRGVRPRCLGRSRCPPGPGCRVLLPS
jgi:hypothetical protein